MGRYDTLYQAESTPPATPEKQAEPIVQPQKKPQTVRSRRSVVPNDRTDKSRNTLLDELNGETPTDTRKTERFSFEIYSDLKPQIEELQYRFKKRTGKKISSSRIIREAVEAYLPKAMQLVEEKTKGESDEESER